MCGIGGCVGVCASSELMAQMSMLTKHRGPDDYGEFVDGGIGVFSNRLSIIDLESGHQPIFNEDGNLAIVFNGEIYNFPELRAELEKQGHKFKTRTDTEVILHGFEQNGPSIFRMLDGMFACAIWERKSKRLILARDRVGVKPLYYAYSKSGDLVFCSEIKGILCHPEIVAQVNSLALYDLISLYYLPFDLTMFEGIKKLPPGHYFDSASRSVQMFWSPPELDSTLPGVQTIRSALERSITRQLLSDVEVGAFLSGGLDTSTIVAFASKHYTGKLKTFCMGFGHEDDEIEDARRVSEYFGTDHHEFTITDRSSLELYPQVIWHSEVPKVNTYSWFVNERASKFVKVCLSGLGGDELFFGYATSLRFESFRKAEKLMRIPLASSAATFASGKQKAVLSNIKNRPSTYLTLVSPIFGSRDAKVFTFPTDQYRKDLETKIDSSFFRNKETFVQQTVRAEFGTKLPDDFLSIDDSMSMAHSLENRVPLLDNELLDLMLPVNCRENYSQGTGKTLLRKAMRGILPESCFTKPKQGFSLNLLKWWKSEMGEEIRRTIGESKIVARFFDVGVLNQMIPAASESYSTVSLLWHVYAFHLWYDLFIENGRNNIHSRASALNAV